MILGVLTYMHQEPNFCSPNSLKPEGCVNIEHSTNPKVSSLMGGKKNFASRGA